MPPKDIISEVTLQVGQVSQERIRRGRQICHTGRIRSERRQRTAVGGPQSSKDLTGAPGEALGQHHQESALAAEALDETARRDAGFASDVGQGELVRAAAAHGALSRCEEVFVRNLLASSWHR
jgi:hypothetical protein